MTQTVNRKNVLTYFSVHGRVNRKIKDMGLQRIPRDEQRQNLEESLKYYEALQSISEAELREARLLGLEDEASALMGLISTAIWRINELKGKANL